jgi:hypothetical protein
MQKIKSNLNLDFKLSLDKNSDLVKNAIIS